MDRITVALLRARRQGAIEEADTLRARLESPAPANVGRPAPGRVIEAEEVASASPPGRRRGRDGTTIVGKLSESVADRMTEAMERATKEHSPALDQSILRAPSLLPVPVSVDVGAPGIREPIAYTRSKVIQTPHKHLVAKRVAVDGAHPKLLDAVRLLRTQVLQRMKENGWRTLAIVGSGDDEGKTLVAVNLAVSIAMELNHSALLVDANLRRPGVHSYFAVPGSPGLAHYLVGQAPIDSLLVNPGIDRLLIMPAGATQPNSAELLGSTHMKALVADVRRRYDDRIVLFDLPPLLRAADALAFLPFCDAALLVVGDGKTGRDELQRVQQLLGSTNLLGVTLNLARKSVDTDGHRGATEPGFFRRMFSKPD
jgi:capsular exopolysaccharide synthesis family protein